MQTLDILPMKRAGSPLDNFLIEKSAQTVGAADTEAPNVPAVRKKFSRARDEPEIKFLKKIRTGELVEYDVVKVIGEGVFGIVFEVTREKQHYAMKVLKHTLEGDSGLFEKEVAILQNFAEFRHENVLSLVRTHTITDSLPQCSSFAIVTDLLGYSMHTMKLGSQKKQPSSKMTFSVSDIRIIGKQILSAMSHLEMLNIYHLDLKPENILFVTKGFAVEELIGSNFRNQSYRMAVVRKKDLRIQIGDFGSARQHLPDTIPEVGTVQVQNYRAPEIFLGLPYNMKSDVWSVGCILFEMYTGEMLFYGSNSFDTESVQFEMMQRVLQQAPSERMWRMAYEMTSSKVKMTKYGFKMEQVAHRSNLSPPLRFNIRHGDVPAVMLFKLLYEVFVMDPLLRPSFAAVSAHQFFQ